jgi:hypothetical protein
MIEQSRNELKEEDRLEVVVVKSYSDGQVNESAAQAKKRSFSVRK